MYRTPFDHVPEIDPGTPDVRSVPRFLWWIGVNQKRIVLTGTFFGIINLLCVAIMPGVLGRGIQAIADNNNDHLRQAVLFALLLGICQAAAGILRHSAQSEAGYRRLPVCNSSSPEKQLIWVQTCRVWFLLVKFQPSIPMMLSV